MDYRSRGELIWGEKSCGSCRREEALITERGAREKGKEREKVKAHVENCTKKPFAKTIVWEGERG